VLLSRAGSNHKYMLFWVVWVAGVRDRVDPGSKHYQSNEGFCTAGPDALEVHVGGSFRIVLHKLWVFL